MRMNTPIRTLVLALAIAGFATAAAAQKQPPAPEAPAAQIQADAATTEAVRDVFVALFFDTGMFDMMMVQFVPMIRETAMNSDFYREASARQRAALTRLIEETPAMMRAEIEAEAAVMAYNVSGRVAAIMQPSEVSAFAEFLRAPEWRPLVSRLVGGIAGGDNAAVEMTEEEEAELMVRFEATPNGAAVMRHSDVFLDILVDEMGIAGPRLDRRMQARMSAALCAALEDDCPPDLRALTRGA